MFRWCDFFMLGSAVIDGGGAVSIIASKVECSGSVELTHLTEQKSHDQTHKQ